MLAVNKKSKSVMLNNCIEIIGDISNFTTVINGKIKLYNCNAFTYYQNSIFVTKSQNKVYVYYISKSKAKLKYIIQDNSSYCKIRIKNTFYTIDFNCNITMQTIH